MVVQRSRYHNFEPLFEIYKMGIVSAAYGLNRSAGSCIFIIYIMVENTKNPRLFNRRPPRGETAAPLLFSAILSKRSSENAVHSKKAQCERQLCLGFIRRVLGCFLAASRRNLGKFSAELRQVLGEISASSRKFSSKSRQVLGGPKNFQRLPKRQPEGSQKAPEGGQKAPRMPKSRRKGCQKASKGIPKPQKNESVFANRFRKPPA